MHSMYVRTYVPTYVRTHVRTHTCTYTSICAHVCMRVMCASIRVCMYARTYVYVYFFRPPNDHRARRTLFCASSDEERESILCARARLVHTIPVPSRGKRLKIIITATARKKVRQKARYFLILNSRARDMQISREAPFLYVPDRGRFLPCVFARIRAITAMRSHRRSDAKSIERNAERGSQTTRRRIIIIK